MRVSELLDFLFGGEPSFVEIFDNEISVEITDYTTTDGDDFFLNMLDAEIDLRGDGKVYAVATNQLPPEKATLVLTKDNETVYVYCLKTPVDTNDVPNDLDIAIPIGVGWGWAENSESMYELDDLISFKSTKEEDRDDSDGDVVSEIPVEIPMEDGPDGEPTTASEDSEIEMMNDAEILGVEHPDMAAFLDQPLVFMTGDMYGQRDRRNTFPGKWKRVEMPLINWMVGGELKDGSEWGLTRHPVNEDKEGSSIVPSDNFDGERTAEATKAMYAIGIDIDTGNQLDDVIDKLLDAGVFALVYTTHSHMKTSLSVKSDIVQKTLKIKDTPTRSQVQEYLMNHHKDRHPRSFVDKIEIVDAKHHTKDGLHVLIKTPPVEKFRVIIPLDKPVELTELASSFAGWKEAWADLVCGVCVNMLGAEFDTASCDINRLFYSPRHREGADFYSAVIQGKPLSISDVKPHSKEKYVRQRKAGGDPFLVDTGDSGGAPDVFNAPSGMNLNDWHRRAKDRFLISDVLETFCEDKIRTAGGERSETTHLECPFEHEHSTSGGTATMAMNPDANKEGVWTVFCRHDSCSGRHKLEFLSKMMEEQWFEEDVLKDDGFLIPLPDQDLETTDEDATTLRPAAEEAEAFDDSASDKDIEKFMKRHQKMGADNSTRAAINKVLLRKTDLSKSVLNGMWRALDKEQDARRAAAALEDLENFEGMPLVNIWGSGQMMEWARLRIQTLNTHTPKLFHYMEGVSRVIENSEGQHKIKILKQAEFASELNKFTKWQHQVIMGDQVRNREVFAPKEVVENLYNDLDAIYPVLRAVTSSPMFTYEGEMITAAGYHSSGVYYAPDRNMDLPQISEAPTQDEVTEAKRLLIEEVLADFPFAGLEREEIIAEALFGDGVPAITHVISMLLLFFCRDMIEGPTPAHLIGKPTPGTGASLLAEVISIIATGDVIAATELPSNTEELSKSITAFLAKGSPMIFYDNISHSVDSGGLAMALTSSKHEARILGESKTVEALVRCVWVLTGNNVQLSGELLRRCCLIDMDAQMAEPEAREDWRHHDIRRWCRDNRGELVWACLTLIQNWVAADFPDFTGKALNSYENWSYTMGGICETAGLGGFLGNRQELKNMASDGRENDILYLIEGWWKVFTNQWAPVRQSDDTESLISMSVKQDIQLSVRKSKDNNGDPTYNPINFEQFLTKYQNRVFKLPSEQIEVKIEKSATMDQYGHQWRLVPIVEEPKSNVDG